MKKLQVIIPEEQWARMDEYLRGLGKPFYTRSDLVRDLIFEKLKDVRPVDEREPVRAVRSVPAEVPAP